MLEKLCTLYKHARRRRGRLCMQEGGGRGSGRGRRPDCRCEQEGAWWWAWPPADRGRGRRPDCRCEDGGPSPAQMPRRPMRRRAGLPAAQRQRFPSPPIHPASRPHCTSVRRRRQCRSACRPSAPGRGGRLRAAPGIRSGPGHVDPGGLQGRQDRCGHWAAGDPAVRAIQGRSGGGMILRDTPACRPARPAASCRTRMSSRRLRRIGAATGAAGDPARGRRQGTHNIRGGAPPPANATEEGQQGAQEGRQGILRRGAVHQLRADRPSRQGQKGHVAPEPCRAHACQGAARAGGIHRVPKGPQVVLHIVRNPLWDPQDQVRVLAEAARALKVGGGGRRPSEGCPAMRRCACTRPRSAAQASRPQGRLRSRRPCR